VIVRRLNRYKVIEIRWLSGIDNFVSKIDDFIFNSFRNFKPVKRFQNRSDTLELRNQDNNSIRARAFWVCRLHGSYLALS